MLQTQQYLTRTLEKTDIRGGKQQENHKVSFCLISPYTF